MNINPNLPILLDGAMGTELAQRKVDTGLPLWSANALLHAPEIVRQIHTDYLNAGARVITTNTFRTNTRTLLRAGLYGQMRELISSAVTLARDAASEAMLRQGARQCAQGFVAGSIAPVEDCYSPWLVPQDEGVLLSEHRELAGRLAEAGCDLLLVETMNTSREAAAAARAAAETGLPVWVSFVLDAGNRLLDGEALDEAVRCVLPYQPQAVLVNCIPVAQVTSALALLRHAAGPGVLTGAYANAGHVEAQGWTMAHGVSPGQYAQVAREWLHAGAAIIGGCCGTTPDHIGAVAEMLHIHPREYNQ